MREETLRALKSLGPDEELALHSTVMVDGQLMHIPMIDFQHSELDACVISAAKLLGWNEISTYAFFDSGRSYHAYSCKLISPESWPVLMGKLLLVNPKNNKPVVDTRWIGHRLIAGYSALRWSNNSGRYNAVPAKVDVTPHLPLQA